MEIRNGKVRAHLVRSQAFKQIIARKTQEDSQVGATGPEQQTGQRGLEQSSRWPR